MTMKQGKENFEFIKESENTKKRNYIFKNDKLTTGTFYFIAVVLVILIVAVAMTF